MKIVLVYPSYEKLLIQNLDPPLDLINIANSIKQCGDVSICDLRVTNELPEADVYGLTATTPAYSQMVTLLRKIKQENPNSRVIIGGHHVSALPFESLTSGFDKVFVGECEITLPQVLKSWDKTPALINGEMPWYLPSYKIHEWVNKQNYVRSSNNVYSLILSRGCVFDCRYCASSKYFRKMEIAEAIKTITSLGNIEGLRFMDENFLIHRQRFLEIAHFLKELSAPYFIFCRGEDLDDESILHNLHSSGCKVVSVGFETASQHLHNLSNTGKDVNKMIRGIMKARDYEIDIRLNLMIGLPGETWKTIKETVDKINQIDFVSYSINYFVPYPGTFWYNGTFDFDNAYCVCGKDEGYHSHPQIEQWQEYFLSNIKGVSHSNVSGRGLL